MIKLRLTDQECDDIAEALDSPDVGDRYKKKLLVITMHHQGAQHGFIADCMRISPTTLIGYLREYEEGGLPGVLEDRYYRPTSALEPFWQCLICSFKVAPAANAKEAVERIERMTGVRLSESQCRRAMKKMGMSLKKTAPIPGKADAQLQFEFYQSELLPRLAEAESGKRKVFFMDAAHFVLGAFLGLVWCFARPFIKTSAGRQRYSVLGAIDSHSRELVSIRTTGNVNAALVCELLTNIRELHPGQTVSLVMDNARYQHCREVMERAATLNIELLFLPAYSPNLNLIERLWKLVKKRCLTNKYYQDFAAFRTAIDNCLSDLAGTSQSELESLMALNFQFFKSSNS